MNQREFTDSQNPVFSAEEIDRANEEISSINRECFDIENKSFDIFEKSIKQAKKHHIPAEQYELPAEVSEMIDRALDLNWKRAEISRDKDRMLEVNGMVTGGKTIDTARESYDRKSTKAASDLQKEKREIEWYSKSVKDRYLKWARNRIIDKPIEDNESLPSLS